MDNVKIAVIGLGYVGLPFAHAFSEKYEVVGFDITQWSTVFKKCIFTKGNVFGV